MRKIWTSLTAVAILFSLATMSACDGDSPKAENNPELITTVNITFTPKAGGSFVTFQAKDADGDGPGTIVIDNISLPENTAYSVRIQLLNHLENPPKEMTTEVKNEGHEHQLFYSWIPSSIFTGFAYKDADKNGLPIGVDFEITTGPTGSGAIEATLKHQPDGLKKSNSTVSVGETDMRVTFNVTITK